MSREKELDQFYTNPLISDQLVSTLFEILPSLRKKKFFEPSAGTGNFITSLLKEGISRHKIEAVDIDPKDLFIQKDDYLTMKIPFSNRKVIVGNPPFGKRGDLALKFLNKGLQECDYVAMIMPNIFNRYSIHKNVKKDAKLIYSSQLDEKAFILNDKEYGVKCVFQIWVNKKVVSSIDDLRIKTAPEIRHADFETWIYNNTSSTLKFFDKDKYKWDFAVVRQGFYDYKEKITDPSKLLKNRQYFFVKANSTKALSTILEIDFKKLSQTNTQVLGFSTTDFVKEYVYIKEKNAL